MTKILFICLGNICRSPAAEAIMNDLIAKRGLTGQIYCESAGTSGYHEGEMPDPRMIEAGTRRGLKFETRSRPLRWEDFEKFDYLMVMDDRNYYDTLELDALGEFHSKVHRITAFCTKHKNADHVPDPYYGGADGFNGVLDLLEDACSGLLEFLNSNGRSL
jgi:protein-tyrosine phosphatase